MQPTQKAGEPSMEEILASIRQIIADDPPAPAPQNGATPAAAARPDAAPSKPAGTKPALSAPPAGGGSLSALERDLAELLRDPVELSPPASPTAGATSSGPPSLGSGSSSNGLGAWLRGRTAAGSAAPSGPAAGRQ